MTTYQDAKPTVARNRTGTILRLNKKNFEDEKLLHEQQDKQPK